ncbi:MAG TPA: peptidoglycan DD-metalloendopeptidase family protein [Rhodocyclaceae bacterium]|nr:peptidoglycan DD-metalloendopeptidase family protein [Rhodocyclaceae bacterium]
MKTQNGWPAVGRVVGMSLLVALIAGCASKPPVPVRHGTVPPEQAGTAQAVQPAGQGREHVVQPGDTLLGIGRTYGQSVNDLVAWNNLANPNQIVPGQRIRLQAPGMGAGEPVAVAKPIDVVPVAPIGTPSAVATPLKQEPKGGKQAYNDQAWAAIQPGAGMAPLAPAVPDAAAKDSNWLWPASGTILAGFNESSNKGIDIAGSPGDPVLASAAGKVVYSGSGLRGYGKLVIIKHDENYLTAYAHNRELLVKEGDDVSRGQKIAELGSTDADRPKLHFEIRKQGRPVDPMTYLPPR